MQEIVPVWPVTQLYEGSASQKQIVQLLDAEDEEQEITFHHMRDEIQRLIRGTVEELFDMHTQYDPIRGAEWANSINTMGLRKLAGFNLRVTGHTGNVLQYSWCFWRSKIQQRISCSPNGRQ